MASGFGAVLFVFILLFLLLRGDLELRLRALFSPGTLPHWIESAQKKVGRHIFRFVTRLTGFRITVEPYAGGKLPPAFLIVSNHQSLADIPVLVYAFQGHALRFVTKKELGRGIPMVSPFLKRGGHALISRHGDYGAGRRELIGLARLSAKGFCPVVFPEGTRSRTGALRAFHTGAFRIILANARLPVLSVALDGGYRISRLAKLFSSIGKTDYRVKPMRLYPAPTGKQETLNLLSDIEKDISIQIGEWRMGRSS